MEMPENIISKVTAANKRPIVNIDMLNDLL